MSDALAALLARLAPGHVQWAGKPPTRKVERTEATAPRLFDAVKRSYQRAPDAKGHPSGVRPFAGRLSPTRCGASSFQTKSMRLDVMTTAEFTMALAAITDPDTYDLAMFVGVTSIDGSPPPAILRERLQVELIERAMTRHWTGIITWEPVEGRNLKTLRHRRPDLEPRLIDAVLRELVSSDACRVCHTYGQVIDPHHQASEDAPPRAAWVPCTNCGGTGRAKFGINRRAQMLGIRAQIYQASDWRLAYETLLAACRTRLADAAEAIRDALGSNED